MLPFSEIGYSDMMKILEHIQQYSPYKKVEKELEVPNPGGQSSIDGR